MKATILLFSLVIGILHTAAQGKEIEGSQIVGTWCWRQIRHDLVITFKADGTYEQKYSPASDEADVNSDKGTWTLKDAALTMTSSKKGSLPISSSIKFFGKDRFDLDDFQIYDRIP